LVGGDHARQCGCHLGSEGDGPFAFIREVVKLAHDFLAALGSVQIECLQRWAVVITESVSASCAAPRVEDMVARVDAPDFRIGYGFRVKISKSRQTIHRNEIS